jgi:hypothetical protein
LVNRVSWDYRIIAPSEAAGLAADPGYYVPRTPLGPYRAICDWITSRAGEWHQRDVDSFTVMIGEDGYVLLHLITVRQRTMLSGAYQQRKQIGDQSYDFVRRFMSSYVPADDEGVVEINVEGRGTGDITLVAQCAAWLNATVFDCQTSEMLTAEQWMRRTGDGT